MFLKSMQQKVTAPYKSLLPIVSRAKHVQFSLKIGGPPSKSKYISVNDSERVPRGKGEKNPYKGVKRI